MLLGISILTIVVIRSNCLSKEKAPHQMRYAVAVKEHAAENSVLFTPPADDVQGPYTAWFNDKLAMYFGLDQRTGILSLLRQIDREDLVRLGICGAASKCIIPVLLKNDFNQRFYSINVHIEDVNDNQPQFETDDMAILLKENVPIGYRFFTQEAYDDDLNENCTISYSLMTTDDSQASSVFSLLNPTTPTIVVNQALDYETVQQYDLKMVAMDCGSPANYAELTIRINIEDVNDNTPQCVRQKTIINVPEDKDVNSTIASIEAFDRDSGKNAELTFTMLAPNNRANRTFSVDEKSGEIKILEPLDYETERTYHLDILVEDKGDMPLSTTCSLEIHVYNVNDNDPDVDIMIFSKFRAQPSIQELNANTSTDYFLAISEDTKKDTIVGQVYVFDRDNEHLPKHFVKLLCSSGSGINITESQEYPIKIVSSVLDNSTFLIYSHWLDRESVDRYECVLQATDNGRPARTTFRILHIDVLDVNDNAPSFGQNTLMTLSIKENQPVGTFVHKFNATDADHPSTPNGMVRLYISNSDEFSLDEFTGVLTSNVVFDREQQHQFKFDIIARDQASSRERQLESTLSVIVNILDVNDNSPVFRFKSYNFSVAENVKIGTNIGRVHATDLDNNEQLKYYFCAPNEAHFPFAVLSDGELRTVGQLDYEKQTVYTSTICVSDMGPSDNDSGNSTKSSLTDSTKVMFIIKNINDNCPAISFPDGKVTFLNRDEQGSPGLRRWNYTLQIDDADGDIDKISVAVDHPSMVVAQQSHTLYTLSLPFIVPTPGQYIVGVVAKDKQLCNATSSFMLVVGDRQTDRELAMDRANKDLDTFEQEQQRRPKDKRQSAAKVNARGHIQKNTGKSGKSGAVSVPNVIIVLPALILLLMALMALLMIVVSSRKRRKRNVSYWSNTNFGDEDDQPDRIKTDTDFESSHSSRTTTSDTGSQKSKATLGSHKSPKRPLRTVDSKKLISDSYKRSKNALSRHFGDKFMFKSISDQSFSANGEQRDGVSEKMNNPWIASKFSLSATPFDVYSKPLPRRWTTLSNGADEITI